VIQTALADAYGTWLAVLVTAAAFVAKHLVVDLAAPLFRVTSLVIMATILCGLRARYGTTSSTVAHLLANGVFTGLVFL
jgi:membrane protease YdiL (CAAX protease family)